MKKCLIFCLIFFVLTIFNIQIHDVQANEYDFKEEIQSDIKTQLLFGDFREAVMELKRITVSNAFSPEEKLAILEKNFLICKNAAKYREAGEVLELAYLIAPAKEEILEQVHDKLTTFYAGIKNWDKCVNSHFYYLQNVKVDEEKKKVVFFEIVQAYQQMRQYEKAKLVLGELLLLCKTDADFAYVYFYQARGSFNKNEYEKAIKLYEKALSFEALPDKETGTALYQTGFCHEILGEKKNALQYYEKALPLYGNGQVVKKRMERLQAAGNKSGI